VLGDPQALVPDEARRVRPHALQTNNHAFELRGMERGAGIRHPVVEHSWDVVVPVHTSRQISVTRSRSAGRIGRRVSSWPVVANVQLRQHGAAAKNIVVALATEHVFQHGSSDSLIPNISTNALESAIASSKFAYRLVLV